MTSRPAERSTTNNPVDFSLRIAEDERGDGPSDSSEFDRFEALARRLVRVPKDEIERERDAEKARKG